MGILRSLADRFDPAPETRDEDPSWAALSGMTTTSAGMVNTRTAENLSAVLACVQAISGAMASLPTYVYQSSGRGRDVISNDPVTELIRRGANQWQTWPEFTEWLVASTLLRGNGLAEIVTDRMGRVEELKPIPWDWVSVVMLPSGRLAFDVTEITSVYGGTGRMRRLLQDDVIHLKDRSDDGLVGRSRLQRASSVVEAGVGVQTFATKMLKNGVNPSGVVEGDGKMNDDQLDQLQDHFARTFAGAENAAKALILDQGLKWKQIGVSPEDAELLASRRFSTEELARLYQVPPAIIGDLQFGTFTNAETAGRWFATHTLSPWIRKIESTFTRSLFFDPARSLEWDMSGFLRGDPEQRWQAHAIAVQNQILSVNEVRATEGWNPRDGGDAFQQEETAA